MIKHIVFWKLLDHAEGADRATNALKLKALLDAYQNHPEHVKIKPFFGAVREARQCMDYKV